MTQSSPQDPTIHHSWPVLKWRSGQRGESFYFTLCLFSLLLGAHELLGERNTHSSSHMHKKAKSVCSVYPPWQPVRSPTLQSSHPRSRGVCKTHPSISPRPGMSVCSSWRVCVSPCRCQTNTDTWTPRHNINRAPLWVSYLSLTLPICVWDGPIGSRRGVSLGQRPDTLTPRTYILNQL